MVSPSNSRIRAGSCASFTKQQIQELYEFRAALECFAVRLACQRIGPGELAWLRGHQATGEAALEAGDMDAYRIYNRDLHAAILSAAQNSYLSGMMGQLRLQSEMLMAKTIRIAGRPVRAMEEHQQLIEFIERRDAANAERVMEHHISSAMEDILRWGRGTDAESGDGSTRRRISPAPAGVAMPFAVLALQAVPGFCRSRSE